MDFVASFTPVADLLKRNSSYYPLKRRLEGPSTSPEILEKRNTIFPGP